MGRDPVLVVVLLAVAGCHRGEKAAPPPLRPVRVTSLEASAPSGELRYSASIQPYEQVSLAFKVGGYVQEIATRPGVDGRSRPLQQGDLVKKGDPLARVREADYQQKVRQARAQRDGAVVTLARAKADADRARQLYATKSMTRVDYDAAEAQVGVARSQLAAADADLEAAQIALRDCVLRAPMDALVLSRSVEVGTLAASGAAGFVLADCSRMKAVFGVPESVSALLRVGQPLELQGDAGAAEALQGRVTAVAPSADTQNRVFNVEVTVPNPRGQVRAGTIATVRVPVSDGAASALAGVPLAAVVRSRVKPDGYAVFVVEEDEGRPVARAREVELGGIAGNLIHVAGGLGPKDRVVVTGATLVADGEPVRILE